jgi:hypothetical protein
MALMGSLEEMSFGELLSWIALAGKVGTLVVREGKAEKLFTFDGKRMIAAASNLEWERLGSILIRKRFVEPKKVKEALTVARSHGIRLGRALVDIGALSDEELYYLLILQADSITFDVFFWETGRFVFYSGIRAFEHIRDLPYTLDYLLIEGARRMDEALEIRRTFISPFFTMKPKGGALEEEPLEQRILQAAKEGFSLIEMMALLPQTEFTVLKAAYSLFKKGIAIGPEKTLANLDSRQFYLEFLEHGCSIWRAKNPNLPLARFSKPLEVPQDIQRYHDYYTRLALEGIKE